VDGLVNLEVVVSREMCNGGIDVGIVEDVRRDLIERARRTSWLGSWTDLRLSLSLSLKASILATASVPSVAA